jgi:hypothetical protein
MKKLKLASRLALALSLAWNLGAWAAGATNAPVVVTNDGASGSIELSNISTTDSPEPVAADTKAEPAPSSEAVPAEVANAEATKDPRELHRDKVMQVPEDMPAGTSAASRRYKKVDLATYRAAMQGATLQASQTPQSGSLPTR